MSYTLARSHSETSGASRRCFLCLWSVNEVLSSLKTRESSETVFGTIFRETSKLFMVAVLNYILPE